MDIPVIYCIALKDKSYKFGVNVLFTENEGFELQNYLQSGNPRCMVLGKVSDAINLRVEIPAAVAKINREPEGKKAKQGAEGQRNGECRGGKENGFGASVHQDLSGGFQQSEAASPGHR